jgi:hypothetical protein
MGLAAFEDRVEVETPGPRSLLFTTEDIQHHDHRLIQEAAQTTR